ncbi:hypothetical protein Q7P37_007018 [Cladosporium fusiforme]
MHPVALSLPRVQHPKSTGGSGLTLGNWSYHGVRRASLACETASHPRRTLSFLIIFTSSSPTHPSRAVAIPMQTTRPGPGRDIDDALRIRTSKLPLPHELSWCPPKPIDANSLTTAHPSPIAHFKHGLSQDLSPPHPSCASRSTTPARDGRDGVKQHAKQH